MVPGYITGYTDDERKQHNFYATYRFEGEDLVVDGSAIEYYDFGRDSGWKSPIFVIRTDLALEMGWMKKKESVVDNPRYGLVLGSNLVMELRDHILPVPNDLKYSWSEDGSGSTVSVGHTYWFIQRIKDGSLSDYVRLSTNVNWRFINLNHSFKSVLGSSARSLLIYSDVGSSSVVGNQVTDLLREVDYKRKGQGSYYFEPTHLQYIKVRKDVIDIIEVQVAETGGDLVQFGKGNTIFTLHFKKE